jgi:hypothetical protein
MNISGVDGLVQDIGVSFGLPVVGFVMFTFMTRTILEGKIRALTQRLSLIFLLLLFAYLISSLMYQDRAVLIAIWSQNPILFFSAYSIGVLLVIAVISVLVYFRLRTKLWQHR